MVSLKVKEFDHVVLATQAHHALRLLDLQSLAPFGNETSARLAKSLSSFRYEKSRVVVILSSRHVSGPSSSSGTAPASAVASRSADQAVKHRSDAVDQTVKFDRMVKSWSDAVAAAAGAASSRARAKQRAQSVNECGGQRVCHKFLFNRPWAHAEQGRRVGQNKVLSPYKTKNTRIHRNTSVRTKVRKTNTIN